MENNRLIAEFMGGRFSPSFNKWVRLKNTEGRLITPDRLGYHSSWDWLMPVVDKIECDLGYPVEISESYCRISRATITIEQGGGDCTKISATYQAVIEFINWYNSQTK